MDPRDDCSILVFLSEVRKQCQMDCKYEDSLKHAIPWSNNRTKKKTRNSFSTSQKRSTLMWIALSLKRNTSDHPENKFALFSSHKERV